MNETVEIDKELDFMFHQWLSEKNKNEKLKSIIATFLRASKNNKELCGTAINFRTDIIKTFGTFIFSDLGLEEDDIIDKTINKPHVEHIIKLLTEKE